MSGLQSRVPKPKDACLALSSHGELQCPGLGPIRTASIHPLRRAAGSLGVLWG